ncbi:DoxX family protein [Gimibacter soli]|uniref:DoxX family protein n=1 Tax=Gimibacter soli TaxID=3024400 RepID=A0AAE9XSN1_9PROT|nr:DoxX family protein [Gimibacter soli]WCL54351.1 DoxX family protein [Gimibacter soli]
MTPQKDTPNLAVTYTRLFTRIPADLVQLTLRLGLAGIFWVSARTKVTGLMTISDSTYYLFEEEYQLPVIPADIAAPLATYAEHALPVLLLLGLATRVSALGLFVMALVIQLFVYPSAFLSTHLGWFALALAIMAYGPGRLSLDHLIARRAKRD